MATAIVLLGLLLIGSLVGLVGWPRGTCSRKVFHSINLGPDFCPTGYNLVDPGVIEENGESPGDPEAFSVSILAE